MVVTTKLAQFGRASDFISGRLWVRVPYFTIILEKQRPPQCGFERYLIRNSFENCGYGHSQGENSLLEFKR